MPNPSAKRFVVKILLWLPVTFTVWYVSAPVLTWPITHLTNIILDIFLSNSIGAVQQKLNVLFVNKAYDDSTSLFGFAEPLGHLKRRVSIIVNPLVYTYSLPLVVGMTLATPGGMMQKLKRCGIAWIILIPVQLMGVCSEILYVLASMLPGPLFAIFVGQQIFTWVPRKLLTFAYQFSRYILPMVTPIIVWAVLHRDYSRQLMRSVGLKDD